MFTWIFDECREDRIPRCLAMRQARYPVACRGVCDFSLSPGKANVPVIFFGETENPKLTENPVILSEGARRMAAFMMDFRE